MLPAISYTRPPGFSNGRFPTASDELLTRIEKLEDRLLVPITGAHGWSPQRNFDNPLPTASDSLEDRVQKLEQRMAIGTAAVGDKNRFSPYPKAGDFSTLLPELNDIPEIRIAKLEARIP